MNTETSPNKAADNRQTLSRNRPQETGNVGQDEALTATKLIAGRAGTPAESQSDTDKPHPGAPRKGAYGPEVEAPTRTLTGRPTSADEVTAMRTAQFKGKAPKLQAGRMTTPAEHTRTVHHIKPEGGTTLEQILRPEYFAHVAGKLRPLDLIEVNPADGSYYALIQVRSASRIEAVCEVITYREFGALTRLAQSEEKAFYVRYGSPAVGWQVLRASDKQLAAENFLDESAAQKWLDGHLKSLAA